ncbi:MAG: CPBP family intramembrane metalloprotease [Candidatus Aminicenantes bacterium]|nr:MAG: CPBP family intramembrane metalloprotease [Candidatus Aminicenantes bacterium]
MMVRSEQLFSKAQPKSLAGKIIQFPLVRIFAVVMFILPYLLIRNNFLADLVASSSGVVHIVLVIADAAVSLFVMLLLYRLYAKWIEKREAVEISRSKSLSELGFGILISFGLVGFVVLFMVLLGYYRIDRIDSPETLIDAFVFFGMGAFVQVLAFRLVLFRLAEELLGSWLAFVLIAGIFGIVHLGNPEAGVWSTVSLILGDVLLFAAFIYTRRIWLVWGLHWGWNFFQDGVFGMPNSGVTELVSWIQPVIQGPEWITGGGFGIETSYIAFFISLLVGLVFLKKAVDKKQIVSPIWDRIK